MLAALERAREAERRFLADASHELRTPLTALRGNVDHIARHGADPETIADVQRGVERAVARLSTTCSRWPASDHARPAPAPVALDDLARAAAAAHDDDVTVDAPARVVVRGDEDALRRALDNLVANASCTVRRRSTIAVRAAGGRARVSVGDAGRACPPATPGAAFDRFWRAPGARGARGRASGWRSCGRSPGATAARWRSTAPPSRSTCRRQESLSEPSPTVVA